MIALVLIMFRIQDTDVCFIYGELYGILRPIISIWHINPDGFYVLCARVKWMEWLAIMGSIMVGELLITFPKREQREGGGGWDPT